MTKLIWDKIEGRIYETGVDHGVLYIPSAPGRYDNGVAWNGLISVTEEFGDDKSKPNYFDGVKYLDSYVNGDFSAILVAFTYPDEFLEFEGMGHLGNGFLVDDQTPKVFGLSYRTLIGSELEGTDKGYKIHLLYNLTAVPSSLSYETRGDSIEAIDFSWKIDSVPENVSNYRPTAHAILDSRYLQSDLLEIIENILYGLGGIRFGILDGLYPSSVAEDKVDASGGSPVIDGNIPNRFTSLNPRLPSLETLIDIITGWDPYLIIPDSVTGLSQLVNGVGDLTTRKIPGLYYALPTTRLVTTGVDGFYHLESG